jgi:uncharacterized protein YegP (UPF0339 family)
MATYYIKKDAKAQYYWILKSDNNGNTICMSSEAYASKQNAKDSIEWTRTNAKEAGLTDLA